MLSYGQFLRLQRKNLGLSQDQMAEMLGNDRAEVSRYETDRTMPTIQTILKIRRVLGLSYEEIFRPLEEDISYKAWRKDQMAYSLNKFIKDNELSDEDKAICLQYLTDGAGD